MRGFTITQRGRQVKVHSIKGLGLRDSLKAVAFKDWINALRNDGYSQTCMRFRVGNRFDVYGVLLDILPEYGDWVTIDENALIYFQTKTGGVYAARTLPPSVMALLGAPSDITAILDYKSCTVEKTLGALNDDGATFKELAQILEYHMGYGYEARSWPSSGLDT